MSASASVNNWPKTPLRYVCELNPSVQFDNFSEHDELTFLPMEKIKSGFYLENTDKFSKYSSSYNVFENGDILLAKVTPCFENGNIAIATDLTGGKGFGSSELFVVRARKVLTRFLFYYFQSITFKKEGEASMTGAGGLKRVSPDLLKQHYLPTPDTNVQQTVVEYLDRETARIDALVSEKEQMLALLEEKRAALISRAVTRGLNPNVVLKPSGLDWLGDVPEHWDVCQLKRLWATSDYGISDSIRDEGSIPVLRMSCIDNGKIDISKSGAINDVDEYLLLQRNDLLFNRTNSLDQIAKVGIIDFDVDSSLTFASYLVRIRAAENTNPEYLVYLLNSSEFIDFARKNAIPAIGQANLSPSKYGDLRVPVPDKGEQESIVQYLNRSLENFSVIKIELNDSIRLLKERRSALITAAVTGQLSMEEMQA